MNQKNPLIYLRELIDEDFAFGNDQGRTVYQKLLSRIDSIVEIDTIGISLKGIKRTDASFPRESVISIAKSKRGEVGFYLRDFESKDLIDNWDYAAKAKEQSIIVFKDKDYQVLGPELSTGTKELLEFLMKKGTVTTALVAQKFNITAQNASGKLKKLYDQGLALASKEIAESGGLEYVFRAIK